MTTQLSAQSSRVAKRRRDDSPDDASSRRQGGPFRTLTGRYFSESGKTFRLRRIPRWCAGEETLRNVIRRVLDLDDSDHFHITSVASCPVNPQEKIATISFAEEPDSLSASRSHRQHGTEWRSDASVIARGADLIFDIHFMGFTPLHNADDSACTIDVIALSGLNGHAFGSFKEKNGPFMWLRDALPKDLPNARIFIYGYDTSILDSQSFQTISDIGMAFREALRTIRVVHPESNLERPLVLVGHSLGGIVAKEAVIQMADDHANNSDITNLRSIVGMLLFGVPSEGMAVESLLPMARQNPNEAFLHTLGRDSEVLRFQRQKFRAAFAFEDSKVFSFYETRRSPTAVKVHDKWVMEGPPTVLVDTASAIHGRFLQEDKPPFIYPINQNHSEMIKFSGRDNLDYQAVLSRLKQLHKEAEMLVRSRHQAMPSEEKCLSTNAERPYQQQACLESLAFTEQLQREDEVLTAKHNGTCNWLLDHQNYVEWLPRRTGLLWVQGNPGAGKSTAMKFLVDNIKAKSRGTNQIVISFFFHGRGTSIQRSPIGLYRSLLNQLLARVPKLLMDLTETFRERCDQMGRPGQDWDWGEGDLRSFIASEVPKASRDRPIIICVDALDECGRDVATGLVSYAKQLIAQADNTGGHLKICFSCRYYPSLNRSTNPTISVEKENSADIRTVVFSSLTDLPDIAKIDIVERISQKAHGVFQWAVLVASQVLALHSRGIRLQVIQKRIDETPVELHELYAGLLSNISAEDHSLTLKMFQWVCFAQNPLTVEQLQHAMAIEATMTHQSIEEYQNGDHFADDIHQLETMVTYLSKGLVQIINGRAQFIHQSVSDYLLQCGLQNLHKDHKGSASLSLQKVKGLAHFEISRSCIRYLKLKEIMTYPYPHSPRTQDRDQGFKSEQDLEKAFPLARYSIFSIPWHISQVEKAGIFQTDLPELFSWPSEGDILETWATLADVIDFLNNEWRFHWPVEGSRLLHLLSEFGINSAFDHILSSSQVEQDGTLLDPGDTYHRTPLYFALRNNQDWIFQHLLVVEDVEIEILGPPHSSITPLHVAVERRDIPLIHQLTDLRIDLDIPNGDGRSPMAVAIAREDMEIAKILLTAGAGRQEFVSPEGTIIHYAVRKANFQLLRQAIAAGAIVDSQDMTGHTPLFQAVVAMPRSPVMIGELLAAGANPGVADASGETPLHYAVDNNDTALLLSLLCTRHAESLRRMSGETPLMRAVRNGNPGMVNLLLGQGFVPDLRSKSGKEAIKEAADFGRVDAVLPILCAPNIDPNDTFAVAISIRYIDFASEMLASRRVDPDPEPSREVPLHAAASSGEAHLVEKLLQDSRTDVNRRDHRYGKTALFLAIASRSLEVVDLLLGQVQDIEPDIPNLLGETPLQEAVHSKSLQMCERLLGTGRVSALPPPDRYSMTPLSRAAQSGAVDIVQLLLGREEIKNNEEEVARAYSHALGYSGLVSAERQRIIQLLDDARSAIPS